LLQPQPQPERTLLQPQPQPEREFPQPQPEQEPTSEKRFSIARQKAFPQELQRQQ